MYPTYGNEKHTSTFKYKECISGYYFKVKLSEIGLQDHMTFSFFLIITGIKNLKCNMYTCFITSSQTVGCVKYLDRMFWK